MAPGNHEGRRVEPHESHDLRDILRRLADLESTANQHASLIHGDGSFDAAKTSIQSRLNDQDRRITESEETIASVKTIVTKGLYWILGGVVVSLGSFINFLWGMFLAAKGK